MISITIPTYNRAKFLPRAISSILNQSNQNWELIISDDGSTDDTEAVVGKYLSDPRIKYLKNSNAGATAARNSGVKVSTGDFITFLDSDDEAKPNWLEAFQKEIENEAEVVCCGYEYLDHKGNLIRENYPIDMGPLYNNRIGRFTNGGVFLIKKEYFQKIGGYDENVKSGQHSEMAIRLFQILDQNKIEIKNIYKPLIKVHVHQGPKIRSDHKAIFLGNSYTLNKHESLFSKHKLIYANYLSVGAHSAVKIEKYEEAKKLFYKAWKLDPFNIKRFGRLIIVQFPFMRKKFW
ncbi:glycosyltransferase family 2 protein [Christiangramia echinicola]|uniref:glycosyltransferase family 2 protein n=1 Tax=Christiangramia echinicola TaxID=279359 RepID=UPI00040FCC65|nr:glycosyltransferase family A protein [Christiangramia echinicola]